MGLISLLETKCHRISEISVIPSISVKLLIPVWHETLCTYNVSYDFLMFLLVSIET